MMSLEEKFASVRVWENGDKRAPNKSLLLLLVLGHYQKGGKRMVYFEDIDKPLKTLLKKFGPRRKNHYSHYPFCYLTEKGVWELENHHNVGLTSSGDPMIKHLRSHNVKGGIPKEIYLELMKSPDLFKRIVFSILDAHFEPSIFGEILNAVGIEDQMYYSARRKRDSKFRELILKSYNYKCTICEFQLKFEDQLIALEAAHIKMHNAGGPSIAKNGIALCAIHHKLFDFGAFTLNANLEVEVSEYVNDSKGVEEWLLDFHGKPIHFPRRERYYPEPEYVQWHVREVFKG